MTQSDLRARAIALYDRFTHEGRDRRAFMRQLTLLAGSAAAANALLAGIADDPAAAAIVAPDDKRVKAETTILGTSGAGRPLNGYRATPAKGRPGKALVVVIHENRGLNDHIRDVARRFALAGFTAVAPDFLTPAGGTPADEDQARDMIGKLVLADTVADGVGLVRWLAGAEGGSHAVGVVGFCWGGGMVNRLAVASGDALKGAVSYYGPAPDPAEAARVETPLILQLAGLDQRVNATAYPWAQALAGAGKRVTVHNYPGANHAFNNDTSAERYDKAAATLAWDRTVAFFRETLK